MTYRITCHLSPFARKLLCYGIFMWAVITASCNSRPVSNPNALKADLDTAYNAGSRISSIAVDSEKMQRLTNLGMLWGFIKYYHANVSKGEYNMDAELFRVLPKILAANNNSEANNIMEQWVDHFGVPAKCDSCPEIVRTANTRLMPDYGYLFDTGNLPATLISKLEFIKHNRHVDTAYYYVRSYWVAVFNNEQAYTSKYPDAGLRLLALYRYWNMIQYFFPSRHLIGEDWNKVLTEFIPVFCRAADSESYDNACLQIISRIHDSHANLLDSEHRNAVAKGEYKVPFEAAFIEGKLVVTGYYEDPEFINNTVHVGDVIEKIDGVPVDSLVKKYLPVTPGSNYSAQLRDMVEPSGYLFGGKIPSLSLQILRYGSLADINVQRIGRKYNGSSTKQPPMYSIMPGNIGYIYPATLEESDLADIKIKFKDTKGIVIDIRCYPHIYMPYTYGEWLKPVRSVFVRYTVMDIDIPGLCKMIKTDIDSNGSNTGDHYRGKLVIIVNEGTQSRAEITAMALSSVPGAIVIGSTTAGADGGVSDIVLPGERYTRMSGIGILYPDGSESQRVGVKIDKVVKRTIKGVKEGRDELLEYAVDLINQEPASQ